ncbi:DsbA family protein [Vibrio paucivorans]|uniref:Thioredoxin domain-containing protein n=1 Tax=Vibrio paucivorans TaxID=2829489 RepID=A0A9X3CGZ7_9VIBR|nr:DsbA family protein [Vibrio paucivorans]MCW8335581.1 thioredoxin domain-containing protein [Vibrio paucivorans]
MKLKLIVSLAAASLLSPLALAITQEEKIKQITVMLEQNPTIIDGLYDSLNQYVNQAAMTGNVMEKYHDYMHNNPSHSWFGAENAAVTIINFTDYSCPFCKRLDPVLNQLTEAYPEDVKVINIYVPLRERGNVTNSSVLAANLWKNERDVYQQAHEMLIKKSGVHDMTSLNQIAKRLDVSDQLTTDPNTTELLEQNYQLFVDLGLRGTPGMIVGGQIVEGYLPYNKLEPLVAEKLEQAK